MSDTAAFAYDVAAVDLASGALRWADDDIRVVLVSGRYVPGQSADRSRSDLQSFEVSEPMRMLGRKVDDSGPGRISLRASNLRWPRFSGEFRYAVVFNATSGNLVAYSDLGPQNMSNAAVALSYPEGAVCELVIE